MHSSLKIPLPSRFRTLLLAVVSATFMTFSQLALAENPSSCNTTSVHTLPDFSQCALRWSNELELDARQKIDLQKADSSFLKESADIQSQIDEQEKKLQRQWRLDEADALISQTGNTLAQSRHKLFQVKLRNLEQVKKLLSKEQYKLLLRLMQQED